MRPCLKGTRKVYVHRDGDPLPFDVYEWTPDLLSAYLRRKTTLEKSGVTGYRPHLLESYKLEPKWSGPGPRV